MQIERVSALASEDFVRGYVERNRPVVVTDAMGDWQLDELWTPDYFRLNFGDEKVQVYNSYFNFKSIRKLGAYIQDRFGRSEPPATNPPYIRWYTKLRNVEFFWADAVFEKLRVNWSIPYFLPQTDYVLPFAPAPRTVDPRVDLFPAKGLFISERGARTGLHVDPWGSDAVLCQLYGRKTWVMYAPDQAPYLEVDSKVVDIYNPDPAQFPNFARVQATYEFILEPGEVVYVPHGWYHTASSQTDSISLTWNFVHGTAVKPFTDWLARPQSKVNDDVIRFFFSKAMDGDVTAEAIAGLVSTHFRPGRVAPGEPAEATLRS